MATKTMMRKPYQSEEHFEAEQADDLEVNQQGYIIQKDKPEEKTEEELLQEELDKTPDETLDPEDLSYKKRYGDLRRGSQEALAAEKRKNVELEGQLANATSGKDTARSMDDEALDEFGQENPEAAEVFTNIAQRENETSMARVNELEAKLTQSQQEIDEAKAENYVLGRHSDKEEMQNSAEFHDWVDTKSKATQDGVYDNSTDGERLADILDAYKAETGFGSEKKTKKKTMKESASELVDVKHHTNPEELNEKPTFSLKAIDKMPIDEYIKIEEEVLLAREEGRLVP
jgi:hypothetical protein